MIILCNYDILSESMLMGKHDGYKPSAIFFTALSLAVVIKRLY